ILALQCSNRLHGVRTPDRCGAGFGQTEMAYLALRNQVAHRAGDVLHWYFRVYAMLVQQVDVIRAQALERFICRATDPLRPAVQRCAHLCLGETELGSQHDRIAEWLHRFPQQIFIRPRPVYFSGVEEGHPALEGGADQPDRQLPVGRRVVGKTEAHAAQAERGDFQAAAAEFTGVHGWSLLAVDRPDVGDPECDLASYDANRSEERRVGQEW